MTRLLKAVGALVSVAVMAAGCGGGGADRPVADEFVDATCAELTVWAKTVQAAYTDLQAIGQIEVAGPAAAKEQLQRVSKELADADEASAELADGINARRAPDIASGEDVKKAVVGALNTLRELLRKARTSIDSFDVVTATSEQAAALKADLQGVVDGMTTAITGLAPLSQNSDLRNAFEGSATCRQAGSDVIGSS